MTDDEMTDARRWQVTENIGLGFRFVRDVLEHPELHADIQSDEGGSRTLIILPSMETDARLRTANLQMGRNAVSEGTVFSVLLIDQWPRLLIEFDPEPDGSAINVRVPALPGIFTWAETFDDALVAAEEAITLYLDE